MEGKSPMMENAMPCHPDFGLVFDVPIHGSCRLPKTSRAEKFLRSSCLYPSFAR